MLKRIKLGKFADPGFPGGLAEQERDGVVTHVIAPDYQMHPLREADRAGNLALAGKIWTLDAEGYAIPSDPPPPEEEDPAPAPRKR